MDAVLSEPRASFASFATALRSLSGRFHPYFRDQNRRDIGKYQSKWTNSKMETPGSRALEARSNQGRSAFRTVNAVGS
jgi:hypothetical protein